MTSPIKDLPVRARLKRAAKGKGFKLRTLAPRVGTSTVHLNRVFTGSRGLTPAMLDKIIDALHLHYMADVLHRDAARENGWKV